MITVLPTDVCALAHTRIAKDSAARNGSSNELTTTQELIANMPGVRREGVTEAAGKRFYAVSSFHV